MKKILFSLLAAAAAVVGFYSCNEAGNRSAGGDCGPSALDVIFERKSVRTYTAQAVEPEKVDMMVRAAMAAPSGMDRRPWEIVVVDDRVKLDRLAEGHAKMVAGAPLAIIVCGNTDKSSYWYLDCSAATQNLLLAAESMGLGAVWTAAYPYQDRMSHVIEVLELPDNVMPLVVVPVGYPAGENMPKDKYDPERVHYNKW